ncbi:MAG: DUF1127 domain-containing protein [Rhodobacteraceae bacterium]|nr:DUF1127 domain-containing protein [Paracoccaceae bacterium]
MTLAPVLPVALAAGAGAAILARRRRWPAVLLAWQDRQRQRAALGALDDRLLADVGLGRAEAEREARRLD